MVGLGGYWEVLGGWVVGCWVGCGIDRALVCWVVVLGVGLVLRLGGRWECSVSGWVLGCVSGGGVLNLSF